MRQLREQVAEQQSAYSVLQTQADTLHMLKEQQRDTHAEEVLRWQRELDGLRGQKLVRAAFWMCSASRSRAICGLSCAEYALHSRSLDRL